MKIAFRLIKAWPSSQQVNKTLPEENATDPDLGPSQM